jgi:hypothetical protein
MGNQLLNALGTSITPTKYGSSKTEGPVIFWYHQYKHAANSDTCKRMGTQLFEDENCRGPSGIYEEQFDVFIRTINEWYEPTVFIPDFTSGYMPVDSCLLSSLKCFYNQSCINAIFPYQRITDSVTASFTALKSNNTSTSSRFNVSTRIKSIVDELMVEEWLIEDVYEKYFQQCAPASCTYFENVYSDFLTILNTVIGLLSGLCFALRLVIPRIVKFIRKRWWPPTANFQPSQTPRISCE